MCHSGGTWEGQSPCSIRALVVRIWWMSPCVSFLKNWPFSEPNHRRTGSILKPLKVIKPSEELFLWMLGRKRKKNTRSTACFFIGKPPCNLLNMCLHTSDLHWKGNSIIFSQKHVYGSWWVLQHMWKKKQYEVFCGSRWSCMQSDKLPLLWLSSPVQATYFYKLPIMSSIVL